MVTEVINITQCSECRHVDHTGAFTKGGAKPCCSHPVTVARRGNNCFHRVIPYRCIFEGNVSYCVPKCIPNWCPLKEAVVNKAKLMGGME